MVLDAAVGAAQKGTTSGWVMFAISVVVYVVLALAVTRWISRPLPAVATSPSPTSG
jgi:hypothetical protein